ncbi:dTMP kinase [Candidatus Bathyarchaeota archaeon]|nr:dTMP kinase [Candidatus Bathyarchaeota archaeon]
MPLIVLEGIDKAGKDTQTKLLARNLKRTGRIVNCVSFPDYSTPLGREIGRFLAGTVSFKPEVRQLLYVANRWEREEDIRRWLMDGDIVIADRYMPAGLVYGMANGLRLDWMLELEQGLPKTDLIIVLDISPQAGVERERAKDIYEIDLGLQKRIRSLYLELGMKFGWKVINGEREPEIVAKDVLRLVENELILE